MLEKLQTQSAQIINDIDNKKKELYNYIDYGIIKYEPIKIVELISDYFINNLLIPKNRTVLTIECNDDVEIFGNTYQIRLVLDNVINNAIKFSEKESSIKLILKKFNKENKGVISICVINTGPPISSPQISNYGSTAPLKKGSAGLGLPLSKYLIKLHGGQILIQQINNGTKIDVILPIIDKIKGERIVENDI